MSLRRLVRKDRGLGFVVMIHFTLLAQYKLPLRLSSKDSSQTSCITGQLHVTFAGDGPAS